MKFNKYHIGIAGAVLVIILIVVFSQRSDWDANKFILSADNQGNLNPVSEKYFDDKEKALLAAVDQKIATANQKIATANQKIATVNKELSAVEVRVKAVEKPVVFWENNLWTMADSRYQRKGNYQPLGNYVRYNTAFQLQNKYRSNEFFGSYHERGGFYPATNNRTRWIIQGI